jgi:hypothetical protein
MRLRFSLLVVLCATSTACPPPPTPALETTPVGIVIGEVFVADPVPRSVGDAEVSLLGLSGQVVSVAGREFAFPAVPVGTHTMSIIHRPTGRAARFDITMSQAFQTLQLDPELTTLGEPATLSGNVVVDGGGEAAAATVFLVGGTSDQRDGVGNDGSFTLDLLPPGNLTVGAHLPGYAPALVPVSLASGANTLSDPLVLELTDVDDLALGSKVHLTGSRDASGTLVYLNDGEDIVTTGADGSYLFEDLTPGVYSVRASAVGYVSARLDNIVVDLDGAITGLKELTLSPGQDPPPAAPLPDPVVVDAGPTPDAGPEPIDPLDVTVTTSVVGATVAGVDVTFFADVDHPTLDTDAATFVWTRTRLDGVGDEEPLCAVGCEGDTATAALDEGTWRIKAAARVGGVEGDGFAIIEATTPAIALDVLSPPPGLQIQVGEPFVLQAEASASDGSPVDVTWQLGSCPAPMGEVLATGLNATVAVSAFAPVVELAIVASTDATSVCRSRTLLMPAPVLTSVYTSVDATYFQIAPPPLVPGEGTSPGTITLKELHPAQLVASAPVGTEVSWSSDTGIDVAGLSLDLGALPVGTHLFTLQIGAAPAPVVEQQFEIVVEPGVFTATVTSPLLTDAFLVGDAVPLSVSIEHPWQRSFPQAQVRWSNDQSLVVAAGGGAVVGGQAYPPALLSGLDAGPQLLSVAIVDVLGRTRIAQTQVVMLDLVFDVDIQTPLEGAVYDLGESVPLAIDVDHTQLGSELMESDFTASVISSLDGLVATGLPFGTPVPLDGLGAGHHTLTVLVSDGTRVASDAVSITVAAPPELAVTRLLPVTPTVDLLPADDGSPGPLSPWSFQVENATSGLTRYTWFVDGLLFDDGWFAALPVDPLDPARVQIALPDYDASAAPWNDLRWAPGEHTVELCVSNDAGALREACAGFIARTYEDLTVLDADANGPVDAGEGIVLVGAVRLSGTLSIVGGSVTIAPGTRILAEPGAGIDLHHGVLIIGQEGATPVEIVSVTGAPNGWTGVRLLGSTGPCSAAFHQTALRHASTPLALGGSWGVDDGAVATDLTIEGGSRGIGPGCLDSLERVTIINATIGIQEQTGRGCDGDRTYAELVIEGATNALILDAEVQNQVTIVDSVFRRHQTGVSFVRGDAATFIDVVIERTRFEDGRSGGYDIVTLDAGAGTLTLLDNTFIGGTRGLRLYGRYQGIDDLDVFVRGNRFEGLTQAIGFGGRRYGTVTVWGNAFVDVMELVGGQIANGTAATNPTVDLRANYIGDPTTPGTTGYAFATGAVGARFNLPGIDDHFDGYDAWTVDVDVPLQSPFEAGEPPLAFLTHPRRSDVYHRDSCVRFQTQALVDGVVPSAVCSVTLLGPDLDPATGTPITLDGDGCADDPAVFVTGTNQAQLDCDDGVRTSSHRVTFAVSDDSISGELHRAQQTWSSDITIVGDLTVPLGRRLDVDPGVTVAMAGTDARATLHPSVDAVGSRSKVDLFIKGVVSVNGDEMAPVRWVPSDGVASLGKWGDLVADGSAASVSMAWAEVEGAGSAALAVENGAGNAPNLAFDHVTFTNNETVVGGCPTSFNDVTVDGARRVMGFRDRASNVLCDTSVTVLRASISGIEERVFSLESRGQGPSYTLSILDSTIERIGDRAISHISGGDMYVIIEDSTLRNGDRAVRLGWHGTVAVRDSVIENFNRFTEYENTVANFTFTAERNVLQHEQHHRAALQQPLVRQQPRERQRHRARLLGAAGGVGLHRGQLL